MAEFTKQGNVILTPMLAEFKIRLVERCEGDHTVFIQAEEDVMGIMDKAIEHGMEDEFENGWPVQLGMDIDELGAYAGLDEHWADDIKLDTLLDTATIVSFPGGQVIGKLKKSGETYGVSSFSSTVQFLAKDALVIEGGFIRVKCLEGAA